ncbi:MAG: phosphopentomutase [Clostridia bacterium]|nr:phosphopentomutase [Clostridia bacterium]
MTKRVFLIVLDSVGIGEAKDAAAFGDGGAHTMKSISDSSYFAVPNLLSLGLGNIPGLSFLGTTPAPLAAYARVEEQSAGKDTTIGHWEIAGLLSPRPLPTYPEGFPADLLAEFSRRVGREVLCNKPYSGTEVIKDYGDEHVNSGALIIYTSADSVFQIAAHEEIVPVETLYEYCRIARELLAGEHAVGRVIARPFLGENGNYKRTANRRDFSLEPTGETVLDVLQKQGLDVLSIGKIRDIFAGRGITESHPTHGNEEGMEVLLELQKKDFHGLCFANLVDFDMLYGHRNDIHGYAKALSAFDAWLPAFLAGMQDEDLLLITADHGCDPGDISTDHTRENVPLLLYGKRVKPVCLGVRNTFADIAATVADYLGVPYSTHGTAIKEAF